MITYDSKVDHITVSPATPLRDFFLENWEQVAAGLPDVSMPTELIGTMWPPIKLWYLMHGKKDELPALEALVKALREHGTTNVVRFMMTMVLNQMTEEQYGEFVARLCGFADLCRAQLPASVAGQPRGLLRPDGDGQDHARGDAPA